MPFLYLYKKENIQLEYLFNKAHKYAEDFILLCKKYETLKTEILKKDNKEVSHIHLCKDQMVKFTGQSK